MSVTETPTVLVIEDEEDLRGALALTLKRGRCKPVLRPDGRSGLKALYDVRPDAVVLDIGLPDIDGYELARTIRAAPWGRHTLLIAVTGWGQEGDRRRALEAGFDHHLTKPAAAEALDTLLKARGSALPRASAQPAH